MMTETMNESLVDAHSPTSPVLLTDHETTTVGGGWQQSIEETVLDICHTLSHLLN